MSVVLSARGYAQELTADEKSSLERKDKAYSDDKKAASLDYAWLLYRTGDQANCLKADAVLSDVILLQDKDPESITYGQWNWRWQDGEKFADLNNALFKADMMFVKLWSQQSKMSTGTRAKFLTSCRQLTEAAKRRWDTEVFDIGRDSVAYSNIFALYVETLTLAGDRFDDARLKKMAKSQWTRWYSHISFFGIDEFASPTYNYVIFSHLMNIHDFSHDERIERESKEVMDHVFLLQSALTHPLLKVPVSGISRDYRDFLMQSDARSRVLTGSITGYAPPPKAVEINEHRTYPFEVIGKASIMPFVFKSYQLQYAAMGSMTGGNCFQQQIHCMAVVGKNENERAVLFVQGSNTPVNGFTDQIGTSTLCVYNRLPTYWHLTQWRGDMTRYKETSGEFGVGISPNWHEKLNTPGHIVLAAYDYDVHVFPFAVANETLAPCELPVKHRTSTSPRYHPRPRVFNEYVFPQEPDWFGAYITLVKSGTEVAHPSVAYSNADGILSFKTNVGHQVRLFIAEKGDTRQLFNIDPALIPRLKITEPKSGS
jgi:hypothetical protein